MKSNDSHDLHARITFENGLPLATFTSSFSFLLACLTLFFLPVFELSSPSLTLSLLLRSFFLVSSPFQALSLSFSSTFTCSLPLRTHFVYTMASPSLSPSLMFYLFPLFFSHEIPQPTPPSRSSSFFCMLFLSLSLAYSFSHSRALFYSSIPSFNSSHTYMHSLSHDLLSLALFRFLLLLLTFTLYSLGISLSQTLSFILFLLPSLSTSIHPNLCSPFLSVRFSHSSSLLPLLLSHSLISRRMHERSFMNPQSIAGPPMHTLL